MNNYSTINEMVECVNLSPDHEDKIDRVNKNASSYLLAKTFGDQKIGDQKIVTCTGYWKRLVFFPAVGSEIQQQQMHQFPSAFNLTSATDVVPHRWERDTDKTDWVYLMDSERDFSDTHGLGCPTLATTIMANCTDNRMNSKLQPKGFGQPVAKFKKPILPFQLKFNILHTSRIQNEDDPSGKRFVLKKILLRNVFYFLYNIASLQILLPNVYQNKWKSAAKISKLSWFFVLDTLLQTICPLWVPLVFFQRLPHLSLEGGAR